MRESSGEVDMDDRVGARGEIILDARVRAQYVRIAHAEYRAGLENLSTAYLREIGHWVRS
jgi:hypothetical protein